MTDADNLGQRPASTVPPSAAWFADGFRKVHILYVSPPWARDRGVEFRAEEAASQLAEAGADTVELYCKDHHGVCYYPSSLGLPYPRDVVGEFAAALKRHGIRFVAYISTAFDNYAAGIHPEWRMADEHGRPRQVGPFPFLCLRSPYRMYAIQQVVELVEHCEMDGLWVDIVPMAWEAPHSGWWTPSGESGAWLIHDAPPCYCMSCSAQYRDRFARPLPRDPLGPEGEEWWRFRVEATTTLIDEFRGVLQARHPAAILTYNGAGSPGDPFDQSDLVSMEGHAPNYNRQTFLASWGRYRGKPFEVITSGGMPVSGYDGWDQKPESLLKLESAIAVSQGGTLTISLAAYPNGAIDPVQIEGLGRVWREIAPLEALLRDPAPVAEVLLASTIKPASAPRTWGEMTQGLEFWHEALRDGHFLSEIGSPIDHQPGHRVMVLADQWAMSDDEIQAVEEFVRSGGTLIATGFTSLLDQDGSARSDFGLADVFGVSYAGRGDGTRSYLYPPNLAGTTDQPRTLVLVNRSPVEIRVQTARTLAEMDPPEAPDSDGTTVLWGHPAPDSSRRRPGILLNEYGSGRCLYVAVPLDAGPRISFPFDSGRVEAIWVKQIAIDLVRFALGTPALVTTAPPGVQIVVNQHPHGLVLHLINLYAGQGALSLIEDRSMLLSGIEVELDLARLPAIVGEVRAVTGEVLRVERSGSRLRISVDAVSRHTIVALPAGR